MSVKDTVVLVTGGASGIGLAFAKAFLLKDAKGVVLLDVNETTGNEVFNSLSKEFGTEKVVFLQVDVADKQSFKDAFERALDKFGHVDILVNSAGIMDEYNWEKMLDINVKGTANGCYLATEEYFKGKAGSLIINLSSIAGLSTCDQVPFYTMSKHAVIGLTRALGSDFNFERTGVKVIAICPGRTSTPILDNIFRRVIYAKELEEIVDTQEEQSPEQLAECVLEIIDEAKNGSAWIVYSGKAQEANLPDFTSLLKV